MFKILENKDIAHIREEYLLASLSETDVAASPIVQFQEWLNAATTSNVLEPTAMVLSTVGDGGVPSSRVVLLKGFGDDGFIFFTNYESKKGSELSSNRHASLLFFWPELQRQVRIVGVVDKVKPEDSTLYFQSRPRSSQIGAWASPQSQVVPDRSFLEDNLAHFEKEFEDQEVLPRPSHWGGFSLRPNSIEFWQGRGSRMHDRIHYLRKTEDKQGEGAQVDNWIIQRLAP